MVIKQIMRLRVLRGNNEKLKEDILKQCYSKGYVLNIQIFLPARKLECGQFWRQELHDVITIWTLYQTELTSLELGYSPTVRAGNQFRILQNNKFYWTNWSKPFLWQESMIKAFQFKIVLEREKQVVGFEMLFPNGTNYFKFQTEDYSEA